MHFWPVFLNFLGRLKIFLYSEHLGGYPRVNLNFSLFPFLAVFGFLARFFGFWLQLRLWAFLGVLVSYKITRGIKLVVGGVIERFWGGLGGLGGSRGVKGGSRGVCSTPIGHVLPLCKSFRSPDWVPNTT